MEGEIDEESLNKQINEQEYNITWIRGSSLHDPFKKYMYTTNLM